MPVALATDDLQERAPARTSRRELYKVEEGRCLRKGGEARRSRIS
jgi:hypothetical protein